MEPLFRKKSLLKRKNEPIILLVLVLVFLGLNIYKDKIKDILYLSSASIQSRVWTQARGISDFLQGFLGAGNLQTENNNLKKEAHSLLYEISSLKEIRKENQILREALGLGVDKDFQIVQAMVIGKDFSSQVILINKGLKHGVSIGFPVITPQKVLGGKVRRVYDNFSEVALLTNLESKFGVKIGDKGVEAVAKGRGDFTLLVDFIPKTEDIKKADLVLTSGSEEDFPSGLLVGEIKMVYKADTEPFQKAEIMPFFDWRKPEILFVISNYK